MKRSFKAISAAVAAAMTISGMAAVPCYAGIKIPFIGEIGGSSVEAPELESMFGRLSHDHKSRRQQRIV